MHSIARTVFIPVLKKTLILGVVDAISITALFFIGSFLKKRLPQGHRLKKVITLYKPFIRMAIMAILLKNDFSLFIKTYFGKFFVIMKIVFRMWFTGKPNLPSKKIIWFSHSGLLGLFLKEHFLLIKNPFFYQVPVMRFISIILFKKYIRPLIKPIAFSDNP